jgi:hypothetical protein
LSRDALAVGGVEEKLFLRGGLLREERAGEGEKQGVQDYVKQEF